MDGEAIDQRTGSKEKKETLHDYAGFLEAIGNKQLRSASYRLQMSLRNGEERKYGTCAFVKFEFQNYEKRKHKCYIIEILTCSFFGEGV